MKINDHNKNKNVYKLTSPYSCDHFSKATRLCGDTDLRILFSASRKSSNVMLRTADGSRHLTCSAFNSVNMIKHKVGVWYSKGLVLQRYTINHFYVILIVLINLLVWLHTFSVDDSVFL